MELPDFSKGLGVGILKHPSFYPQGEDRGLVTKKCQMKQIPFHSVQEVMKKEI